MKQYKRRNARDKFDDTDDWCFVCKDGGELVLCDHKDCLKVYHPECVGRDDSSVKNGLFWTCSRHSCFLCKRETKFYCFCCPNSICGHCDSAAHFVVVQRDGGLCDHCLNVILLIEENVNYDLDGHKIDFDDRNTIEGLFKEYWEIIKEKAGLTEDHVHSAKIRMKGKKCKDADGLIRSSNFQEETDWESDSEEDFSLKKRLRKVRSSTGVEFEGWGSKALIQFLITIGKDTSKPLSQVDVLSVISRYISDKKLFHPEKKRVVFDNLLYSLFRRKSAKKHKIYFLLEPHLNEILGLSDESESDRGREIGLEPENKSISFPPVQPGTNTRKPPTKELVQEVQETGYAAINEVNIKLVYLKKSMIEELLKQPESFEGKIVGSFIKVKAYEGIYFPSCIYQLLQVTGVKRLPLSDDTKNEILLQGNDFPSDITISMLSDSDFSKEECDELREKVHINLSKKLTVVELQEKAISLHADLTKHWINRELYRLDRLIEQANEKGWRKELFQYLDQRSLLKKPSEQERLLKQIPKVIPETITLSQTPSNSSVIEEEGYFRLAAADSEWNSV